MYGVYSREHYHVWSVWQGALPCMECMNKRNTKQTTLTDAHQLLSVEHLYVHVCLR